MVEELNVVQAEETKETKANPYLRIEFKEDGRIEVDFKVPNEMTAIYLLNKAERIIENHFFKLAMQQQQRKEQLFKPSMAEKFKRMIMGKR